MFAPVAAAVLLLKGSGEVVKTSTSGSGADMTRWETYVFPLGLVITLPTQLLFINKVPCSQQCNRRV